MTAQRPGTWWPYPRWLLGWLGTALDWVANGGEAKVGVQPLVLLALEWQRQATDDAAAPVGSPGWACGHAMGDVRRQCAKDLLAVLAAGLGGPAVNPPATVAGTMEGSST